MIQGTKKTNPPILLRPTSYMQEARKKATLFLKAEKSMKRILLISENIILTLFIAPVACYWSFLQKNTDFCFQLNRLVRGVPKEAY